MNCKKCGAKLVDDAAFCTKCGTPVAAKTSTHEHAESTASTATAFTPSSLGAYFPINTDVEDDQHGWGWAIFSLLLPIVGIVLYFVWRDKYPKKASICGTWGAAGCAVWIGLKFNPFF